MIRTLSAAALAVALSLPLSVAPAAAQGATVPANKTTEVGFLWAVDLRNCGNVARPKVRIRQPENGKITTKWLTRTISGARGRAKRCNGRAGKGTAVYYTPNRGYRGPDSFSISTTNRLDGRQRTRTESGRVVVR